MSNKTNTHQTCSTLKHFVKEASEFSDFVQITFTIEEIEQKQKNP